MTKAAEATGDDDELEPHTIKVGRRLWREAVAASAALTGDRENMSGYIRRALRNQLEADRKARKR